MIQRTFVATTTVAINLLFGCAFATAYEDLPEIYDRITNLAASAGADASWFRLTDGGGAVICTEGTPYATNLYCLKVAKGGTGTGRRNMLILGNQHAREWIGYRCVLDCAEFIIDNRNTTTWPTGTRFDYFRKFKGMNISNLTDNANIYFIPMMNPTGYAFSWGRDATNLPDAGWRKNRRPVATDPVAPNGYHGTNFDSEVGVDLNRNWPGSDWGQTNTRAFPLPGDPLTQIRTCRFTNEDVYCGRPSGGSWAAWPCAPICEKELEGVVKLIENSNYKLVIDVHSSGGEVFWCENADSGNVHVRPNQGWTGDLDVMRLLAAKAAALIKDADTGMPSDPKGWYPVSGDVLWYQYEKSGSNSLCFLIEVGALPNFRPTDATGHAEAVLPGMLFMMFSAIDTSFAGTPKLRFRKP